MTVIAYRGGVMAADRRAYSGDKTPIGCKTKVHRLADGTLWGQSSRNVGADQILRRWLEAGCPVADSGDLKPDDFELLVIRPNGEVFYANGNLDLSGPLGIFSQSGPGISSPSAMAMGAGPEYAVEVAIRLDPWSGGGVDALVLGRDPMTVQPIGYGRFLAMAERLLLKWGQVGALSRPTMTGPSQNPVPGPPIVTPALFVVTDYDARLIDGTRIRVSDKEVLMAASRTVGGVQVPLGFDPTEKDVLTEALGGSPFKIISADPDPTCDHHGLVGSPVSPVTSPTVLATASWLRLLSVTHALQAAHIAGDLDEAAHLRIEAHDVLDANLDQRAEAAVAVRALTEGA